MTTDQIHFKTRLWFTFRHCCRYMVSQRDMRWETTKKCGPFLWDWKPSWTFAIYLAFWTLFGLRLVLELQPSMILPALYQLGSKGRLVPISKNNFCKISFSKTPGRWTSLHSAPWCLKQSTTSWPVTSKCKKRFHYTFVIDTSDKAPCVFSVFFKIQVFLFSIFLLQYYNIVRVMGTHLLWIRKPHLAHDWQWSIGVNEHANDAGEGFGTLFLLC